VEQPPDEIAAWPGAFAKTFQEQAEQDESELTILNNKKRLEDGRTGSVSRSHYSISFSSLCGKK
jgi:hypothetical protein